MSFSAVTKTVTSVAHRPHVPNGFLAQQDRYSVKLGSVSRLLHFVQAV